MLPALPAPGGRGPRPAAGLHGRPATQRQRPDADAPRAAAAGDEPTQRQARPPARHHQVRVCVGSAAYGLNLYGTFYTVRAAVRTGYQTANTNGKRNRPARKAALRGYTGTAQYQQGLKVTEIETNCRRKMPS